MRAHSLLQLKRNPNFPSHHRGSLCHLLKLEWNPADPSARKKDPKFPLNLRSFMIPLQGLQWNSEYLFTT